MPMSSIVLVTGASRGLGLELVRQLASRGHRVVATSRAEQPPAALAAIVEQHPENVAFFRLDVLEQKSIDTCVELVREAYGHVDTLINNAGVASSRHPANAVIDADPEDFLHVLQVNTLGPQRVMQAFRPLLLRAETFPCVVNLSSSLGSIQDNTWGTACAYRASKAALNQLTKTWSVECPAITFMCVNPGWVNTDMGAAGNRSPPLEVDESVHALLKLIGNVKKGDSFAFKNYSGETIPF